MANEEHLAILRQGVEVKMPPAFGTVKQAQRVDRPAAEHAMLDL